MTLRKTEHSSGLLGSDSGFGVGRYILFNVCLYMALAVLGANIGLAQVVLREDFAALTSGDNTTFFNQSTSWAGDTLFPTVGSAYQAGGAVKLGSSSAAGTIRSKALDLSGGAFDVSFDVKGWATVEGGITVTATGQTAQTVTYTSVMSGSFETKVVHFSAGTAATMINLATTARRAFLDNIIVTRVSSSVAPTVTISTGSYTYNGSYQGPGVSDVNKGGSTGALTLQYGGSSMAGVQYGPATIPPTGAGNYTLVATVAQDANYSQGVASANFTINKATATVNVSGTDQIYDGMPKQVNVSTSPENLPVTVMYSGSSTAPSLAGDYSVMVLVNSPNYSGAGSGRILKIAKATPSLSGITATSIVAGQPLSTSTISGTAENGAGEVVAGYWTFQNSSSTPSVGTNDQGVIFNPTDTANYNTATGSVSVTVVLDPAGDQDGDGLTNAQELTLGTSAYQKDSDNDGVNDSVEIADGTNPNDATSYNNLNKGLVAYYPLKEDLKNSWPGAAEDIEALNEVNFRDDATKERSVYLTGRDYETSSGGALSLSTPASLRNGEWTIAFWVKEEGFSSWAGESYLTTASSNDNGLGSVTILGNFWRNPTQIDSWLGVAGLHFAYTSNITDYENTIPEPQASILNTWRHYIISKSSGTTTLWVDGQMRATRLEGIDLQEKILIGKHWWDNGTGVSTRFIGRIRNLRLFDRSFVDGVSQTLYLNEAGNLDSDGDGLSDAWERGYGRYQAVNGNFTWDQAKADAEARGGHLATFTSSSEWNQFVSIYGASLTTNLRIGWEADPSSLSQWNWVTKEVGNFSNWDVGAGEPDRPRGTGSDSVVMYGSHSNFPWHDYNKSENSFGYLLEFGYPTDPTKADTDGDGVNDKAETLAGTDPNNATAFPDNQAPDITLIGGNPQEVFKGTTFSDPGATVTDNVDATRTITGSGTLNTATVGIYTLTYAATDAAGNLALPVARTVNVVLDPSGDEDGDGLTNAEEVMRGTNPYQKDSDNDGVNDSKELADGTNPTDASSYKSLSKGLVVNYQFSGNANDSSGNGNNGIPVSPVLSVDRLGAANAAYTFNGTSDRIDLANSAALNMNNGVPFSMSAWIKTDFSDGQRVILAKAAGAWGNTPALFVDSEGKLRFDNFYINEVHSSTTVRTGTWMHVAVTYDGSTYRLYVNGLADGEKAFTGSNESGNSWTFSIGGSLNTTFPSGMFKGSIDEVQFWGRTLSPTEVASVAGIPSTPFTCTIANGLVTITGYTGTGGAVVIPATIGGLPVRVIGYRAFDGNKQITGVVVPEGVTHIGAESFQRCNNLASIALPTTLVEIGSYAFLDCKIKNLEIPEGVIEIKNNAFMGCGFMETVQLPSTLIQIGNGAFGYCAQLTEIIIPTNVRNIGVNAFQECGLLEAVIFQGVIPPDFDGNAFSGIANRVTVYYPATPSAWEDLIISGLTLAPYPFTYTIANGNVTITGYTGTGGNVVIPGTIGGLPVTKIGDSAFSWRTTLTSITIPDSILEIGQSAFHGCSGLLSASIGSGVTTLPRNAFTECVGLTSVSLGANVKTLGDYAFNNCKKLTSITFPAGFESMGTRAFALCAELTSITFPQSVTAIGGEAFYGCTKLAAVNFQIPLPPEVAPNSFMNIASGAKGYYPATAGEVWGSLTQIGGLTLLPTPRLNQTITYAGLANLTKAEGDPSFTLTVIQGASTSPLVFSSSDQSVATISAVGLVSIVGQGSTTLSINQAGDATYNAAPSINVFLTVSGSGGGTGGGTGGGLSTVPAPVLNLPATLTYGQKMILPGAAQSLQVLKNVNQTIPDGTPESSMSSSATVSGLTGSSYSFTLAVKIVPVATGGGFLGDLRAYLRHELYNDAGEPIKDSSDVIVAQTRMLIDQIGVTQADPDGSLADGLNVIFGDSFSDNIQDASAPDGSLLSGNFAPASSFAGTDLAMAGPFSGLGGTSNLWNGTYTLVVADMSTGVEMKLDSWSMQFHSLAASVGAGNPLVVGNPGEFSPEGGLTYEIVESGVGTQESGLGKIEGNQLEAKSGTGTITIRAKYAATGTSTASDWTPKTITLSKASQTITFNPPDSVSLFSDYVNLGATTSSGLAVTYTSQNTGVATIDTYYLRPLAAGDVDIRADAAGNANYENAGTVIKTIHVLATPIKPFLGLNKLYSQSSTNGPVAGVVQGANTYTYEGIQYAEAPALAGISSVNVTTNTNSYSYFAYLGRTNEIVQGVIGYSGYSNPPSFTSYEAATNQYSDGSYNFIGQNTNYTPMTNTTVTLAWSNSTNAFPSQAPAIQGGPWAANSLKMVAGTNNTLAWAAWSNRPTQGTNTIRLEIKTYSPSNPYNTQTVITTTLSADRTNCVVTGLTNTNSFYQATLGFISMDDGAARATSTQFRIVTGPQNPPSNPQILGSSPLGVLYVASGGDVVGTLASVTDEDNGDVVSVELPSYIAGVSNDNGMFFLQGNQLKLRTSEYYPGFGANNQSSYSIVLRAMDSFGLYADTAYKIVVRKDVSNEISFTGPQNSEYDSYPKSFSASAVSGAQFAIAYQGRNETFYATSGIAPTNAGDYMVTATVTDLDKIGSKSQEFTIRKATPRIDSLPTATTIAYGQALSSSGLSGGAASVQGTFTWTSPSTAPTVGISSQSVTFTPTDSANYETVTTLVSVTGALDPAGDEDGDGLSNAQELSLGTNPYQKDSDSDGVLDLREIADGTNPNSAASYNSLNKGLVAYYPFNGNANDESGNGCDRTGTLAFEVDRFGYTGRSASTINASGPAIQVPGDGKRTMSFWLKVNSYSSQHYSWPGNPISGQQMSIGLLGPMGGVGFTRNGYFHMDSGDGVSLYQVGTFGSGWAHFAVVYEGSIKTARVYVNGVMIPLAWWGMGNQEALDFSSSLIAQTLQKAPGDWWIDELRVYNRALSTTEVGQLYQQEAGTLDTDGDGLSDAYEQGYGRYQLVIGSSTWEQAKTDAEARGGHLATITSQDEWNLIWSQLRPTWNGANYWLGGSDQETEGNWQWVTGENWSFNRWGLSEPSGGSENELITWINLSDGQPGWNDGNGNSLTGNFDGYILEYGYPTDPTKADTDGDGVNDKAETLAGTDPNNPASLPDSQSPLITLIGDNPLEIYKGATFTDPGATVIDNVDVTRTITGSATVDASSVGIYTVNYTTTDAAGNLAFLVSRTVNVVLNPTGDEDGDGATNEQELAAETDPYDSASGPYQPVAFGDAFTAKLAAGMTTKVTTASLISNDKYSGIQGETRGVTFDSATETSTRGASIRVKGGWLIYQPSPTAQNGTTDTFTYTVTNGTKTATGTVTVSLVAPDYVVRVTIDRVDGNKVYFSVMPGMTFEVQGTSQLGTSPEWTVLPNGSNPYWTSGADGRLILTDPAAAPRFYKFRWIP